MVLEFNGFLILLPQIFTRTMCCVWDQPKDVCVKCFCVGVCVLIIVWLFLFLVFCACDFLSGGFNGSGLYAMVL